jgi:MFS family permease
VPSRRPTATTLYTAPFVLLCASVFFAANAPNLFIVVPRYLRALGHDKGAIGAIGAAYSLASLTVMPLWARAAERISGRTPIVFGMALCAVGCIGFEWVHTFPLLCAARVLMGAGWSGVLVGSSFCATELAPPGRMAQALGAAGVLTLVALALGPLVGEALVASVGWIWMFRTAAIAALTGAALGLGLPRLRRRITTLDDTGLTGASAAGAGAWARAAARPFTAMVLVGSGYGAVVFFLADDMTLLGHYSITPFYNAYVICAVLVRVLAGSLSDRVGRHAVVIPALLGQAVALAGLALCTRGWQLWPIGALFGVTHGLYYPALLALVIERAPVARRARAAASGNFAFALGMSAAGFGGGALAQAHGYPLVYVTVALASLAAMTLTVWDRSTVISAAP